MLNFNVASYNKLNDELFNKYPQNHHTLRPQLVAYGVVSKIDPNLENPLPVIQSALSLANEDYHFNVDAAQEFSLKLLKARLFIIAGDLSPLVNGSVTIGAMDLCPYAYELYYNDESIASTEDCKDCNDAVKY